ncbi:MAG: EAL domain-containing protein, partial [Methylobacter sp.]|nr:EAL domain-containing protein [Candidatus Methylobacter titanis]
NHRHLFQWRYLGKTGLLPMEIAATIIAMGHILGFKVLAEGVETAEQLAFLQEKGCDMYQGYIKSRPIPAQEFAELLRDQQQ